MMQMALVLIATFAAGVAAQPQMCKEYLGSGTCLDAGCRWVDAWQSPAKGTCTRQCHEFGGAVAAGTDATKAECVSDAIGCRWIQHPRNPNLGKCGKMCGEFVVEQNCALAGYNTCRWAHGDVTGGPAPCTKMCNAPAEQAWCEKVHCVWNPANGACRRKCIEFQMKGPCESIGCVWVTPADGYHLSQCIPPGPASAPAPAAFVNQTTFFAEGQTFKWPTSANDNKTHQFLQLAKKH